MHKTKGVMSDEQFTQLLEYLDSPAGINWREVKKIVTNERGKSQAKKDFTWDCDHTIKKTVAWMLEHNIGDLRANMEEMMFWGCRCDCEVLWKMSEHLPDRDDEKIRNEYNPLQYRTASEWTQLVDKAMEYYALVS